MRYRWLLIALTLPAFGQGFVNNQLMRDRILQGLKRPFRPAALTGKRFVPVVQDKNCAIPLLQAPKGKSVDKMIVPHSGNSLDPKIQTKPLPTCPNP